MAVAVAFRAQARIVPDGARTALQGLSTRVLGALDQRRAQADKGAWHLRRSDDLELTGTDR